MIRFLLASPHWLKFLIINIYGFYLSKLRFSGSFDKYLEEYKCNLGKSQDEIREEQILLLKKNLIYAYENVPYYKELFNSVSFDPYLLSSIEDFQKVPYLTKDIVRMEFANLYSKKVSKFTYKTHHTSGSSGEKLSFLLPNDLVYKKNTAFLYRFYSMWGVNPKDKRVTLGGRIFTNRAPYWITNWFENQLLMSTHHLNFQTVDSYISRIIRFNPIFMQGHPSAILFMAKYILSIKKHVPFNLRVIFSTGETLLMEDQEIIETAFQCKVAQQYGSGENCFSAQQAPNNNAFLINYEHGLIELIGENDLREVVVTSFQNNVMPFIRYKMNDFVKIVEPSFSELYGLPILFNQIVGRTDDVIQLRNGTIIFPVSIRMKIKPFLLAGTNYQLVQISYLQFILNLVDVNRSLLIDQIIKNLNSVLGFDVNIDICFVDTLITKGGKIRNIISHIK